MAAVHFNCNLLRDVTHQEADGVERVKVSYPKFKNGEAVFLLLAAVQMIFTISKTSSAVYLGLGSESEYFLAPFLLCATSTTTMNNGFSRKM